MFGNHVCWCYFGTKVLCLLSSGNKLDENSFFLQRFCPCLVISKALIRFTPKLLGSTQNWLCGQNIRPLFITDRKCAKKLHTVSSDSMTEGMCQIVGCRLFQFPQFPWYAYCLIMHPKCLLCAIFGDTFGRRLVCWFALCMSPWGGERTRGRSGLLTGQIRRHSLCLDILLPMNGTIS